MTLRLARYCIAGAAIVLVTLFVIKGEPLKARATVPQERQLILTEKLATALLCA
ncbi:MAG TPA: hypothetical protein VK464_11835 [Symbiobacteriaceae bacterium]|jgi:hypothetical protein|nr:hypothetical protein [Symbiobacteriaceae bacterium]